MDRHDQGDVSFLALMKRCHTHHLDRVHVNRVGFDMIKDVTEHAVEFGIVPICPVLKRDTRYGNGEDVQSLCAEPALCVWG